MSASYDLAIVGGGPAGTAAAVYAARKKMSSVLITKEWGGQSVVSPDIQNWIGTVSISGPELAESFKEHVQAYAEDIVDVVGDTYVTKVEQEGEETFIVTDENGETYTARTVLLAPGAHRRKLKIPGAEEFDNKGISYCASCDAPLFAGMDVVVVGGGNAGFEAAAQITAHANSITLLQRSENFKADERTVEKVLENEKVTALTNSEPTEIHGDKMVSGVTYKNNKTGEEKKLDVKGVFVEIGLVPNTDLAADLLERDEIKRFKTDPANNRTSVAGIWAAGDCTDNLYHQNNIAAGDAVRALEDIYDYLNT